MIELSSITRLFGNAVRIQLTRKTSTFCKNVTTTRQPNFARGSEEKTFFRNIGGKKKQRIFFVERRDGVPFGRVGHGR